MADIPPQYLNNTYNKEDANLSPLQLAAAYFMDTGKQIPFFINVDFLNQLFGYADSGFVKPRDLGLDGISVVVQNNTDVYLYRDAPDCGPDDLNRSELVFIGNVSSLKIDNAWTFGNALVRGGSLAAGGGGPYGVGSVLTATGAPDNALYQTKLVSNVNLICQGSTITSLIGLPV